MNMAVGLLGLLAVFHHFVLVSAQRATGTTQPFISDIYPLYGGAEGGTRLTITGGGFLQNGLDSYTFVLLAGNECKVSEYYSTDYKLVCTTPKCASTACREDQVRSCEKNLQKQYFS